MDTLKDWLLQHSLSAGEAAQRMSATTEDAVRWASEKRRRDELFGIWSSPDRAFVHPPFQFNEDVSPLLLKELLQVLRTRVGFDPRSSDKGGWARACWLYQPSPALSEQALHMRGRAIDDLVKVTLELRDIDDRSRTPAEVFAEYPWVVIELARSLARSRAHD